MRKRHGTPSALTGVQLSLIVTPMLDMSFQILSFFVMTYHPSALEAHIDGNLLPPSLPATKGPKTEKPDELPAIDTPPELEDALLVILKTQNQKGDNPGEGEPMRILLRRAAEPTPVSLAEDDLPLEERLKVLGKELKKIANEPGQSKANIKIEGDGDLRHQFLMRAYDTCKLAGFQNISFVAPPREK